jgi:large subunit ribosomal protein L14
MQCGWSVPTAEQDVAFVIVEKRSRWQGSRQADARRDDRTILTSRQQRQDISLIAVPGYHGVVRRQPSAAVGDIIVASVKKGNPEMRRQVVYAIIVRQRRPFRRPDGTMVMFEDNAAVITTEEGETKGTDIKGPVAREAEIWPRIVAISSMIVW